MSLTDFSDSAENVYFTVEGDAQVPILRARLRGANDQSSDADVNLAERIGNDNGNLYFCKPFGRFLKTLFFFRTKPTNIPSSLIIILSTMGTNCCLSHARVAMRLSATGKWARITPARNQYIC